MQYESQEIQSLLDIVEPEKIIKKDSLNKEQNFKQEEATKPIEKEPRAKNVFDYFDIENPKELDFLTLEKVYKITEMIKGDKGDNAYIFDVLHELGKCINNITDPISKVDKLYEAVRSLHLRKPEGQGFLEYLLGEGIINMDILADEAAKTGNWVPYLKFADKKKVESGAKNSSDL